MFHCEKCGLCCMHIGKVSLYEGLDRGDGVCRYFEDSTHLCSIYADRPVICNVDKMYELYFKDSMSAGDYYRMNEESCAKFMSDEKKRLAALNRPGGSLASQTGNSKC